MIGVKGIVICVEYDDLLEITLPRNARHLTEILVVTAPGDRRTVEVVRSVPAARCLVTDAFYRRGAKFNKGAAMEEGFTALGRDGWILVWDADIILPDSLRFDGLDPAKLYGANRRILDDPRRWHPDFKDWSDLPLSEETGYPGYFQLFNAAAPPIATRPWYDVTYTHAGGGDGYFQSRWNPAMKERLPFEVLHLGPRDTNWFGRVSVRRDEAAIAASAERAGDMEKFLASKGWGRPRQSVQFSERIQ